MGLIHDIDFWRTFAICTAAVGQTLFVSLYLTFPWWKRLFGRALFFKAVSLGALVDIAVAGRIWDWRGEDVTFVVLYSVLALGIWAQFFAFLYVKVSGNSDRAGAGDDPR